MALVQEWDPVDQTPGDLTAEVNTVTGSATTTGNFLHLTVSLRDGGADEAVSISDAAANTWQKVTSIGISTSAATVHHFYSLNADSITELTVTRTATPTGAGRVFLSEFDDDITTLVTDNGQNNPNSGQPPPCEATFTDTNALAFGSLALGVTSRVLTLQNTTEFSDLATHEGQSLETVNAYGVLSNGTYGPDWDITSGSTNQYSGAVTSVFSGSPKPVANAGPDQTVYVGQGVQLDGSATDGGGAGGPYTWQWTQVSGTAVTLSSATVEDPTFTAPATASTLVFELVATDSGSVASNADSVTITVLDASDVAVPSGDTTVTNWTTEPAGAAGVYVVLSDGSDSTYAISADTPTNQVLRVTLTPLNEPNTGDQLTLSVRSAHVSASSGSMLVELIQGASTVIASDTFVLSSSVSSYDLALSSGEVDSISNPDDLHVQITVSAAA